MFEEGHNAIQATTSDFFVVPTGSRVFDCLDFLVRKKYVIVEDDTAYPRLLRAEKVLEALINNNLTPDLLVDSLAEEINHINPDATLNEATEILIQSDLLIGLVGDLVLDEDSLLNFWLS